MMILISFILIFTICSIIVLSVLLYRKKNNWLNKNWKKIGAIITAVAMTSTGIYLIPTGNPPVGSGTTTFDPYYFSPSHGTGTFDKWLINSTVVKDWLRNNFYWRLQASSDNISWSDANQLLSVDKTWNDSNQSYKITLTLNTALAPKALYYRFDLACNASVKNYINDTTNTIWRMDVPTISGRNLTAFFNWSDIKPLIVSGKVFYKHGIINKNGEDYFWFRIQTINKINKNVVFIIDPALGTISDSTTDSWNWDAQEGRIYTKQQVIRLGTGDYYAVAATGDTGTDYDGVLKTFSVSSTGVFGDVIVDSWEWNTDVDGRYCCMMEVGTGIYAILHRSGAATDKYKIITVAISNTGTITKSAIDTYTSGSYQLSQGACFVHVTGDIYAAIFQDSTTSAGYDFQIETFQISSAGAITDATKDSIEFNSASDAATLWTNAVMVDTNTIAFTYTYGVSSTYYVYVATYDIDSSGDISNSADDTRQISTGVTTYPPCDITHVYGNVYAFTFNDLGDRDGYIYTFTITTAGAIQDAPGLIASYEYINADIYYPEMFTINECNGVYGTYAVIYRDTSNYGYIKTINISYDGATISTIDTLTFESTYYYYQCPLIRTAGNYYFVWYQGNTAYGWAKSFTIETYTAPAWSNTCPSYYSVAPTNGSTGISVSPVVDVCPHNTDYNQTLNITFATNVTGSWVNKQTNSSLTDEMTAYWTYTQASSSGTKYWWRAYIHDGICNVTYTFYFTTAAGAITYHKTIRNTGIDYFTYLGTNMTASTFDNSIVGFDEAAEYIAIWKNSTWSDACGGMWQRWYGTGAGTDFTLHTFDVVEIYLTDSSTQVIDMVQNTAMNYTNTKAITLINSTNKGINFSGYNRPTPTTLSAINTSLALTSYYYIMRWNYTTYDWDWWIVNFWEVSKTVVQWDVIQTKVPSTKVWNT